jgi:hypothetical protein
VYATGAHTKVNPKEDMHAQRGACAGRIVQVDRIVLSEGVAVCLGQAADVVEWVLLGPAGVGGVLVAGAVVVLAGGGLVAVLECSKGLGAMPVLVVLVP